MTDLFNSPLADVDPEVAAAIGRELERQQRTLEMIASENFVPLSVLECQGSVLTNKYAEGYPGRRYYGGCEHVDVVEQLAIDRAKSLFGADHANVQPHSGAQANAAVYHALLDPGDTIMGLALPHGGHLTHGMKINVSGKLYDIAPYEVSPETYLIDMDEAAQIARERQPKLIVAGSSAHPRRVLLAPPRLRPLPRDRRRGRPAADGRHGALRRPRRRRPASVAGAARRRRHDDDPQDDWRRARRHDPLPRGLREEDQLGGVPGPAGRPARARDRGQGGRAQARRDRLVPRAPAAHRRGREGRRRGAAPGGLRRERVDRRDRRPPRPRRPARVRHRRPAGRGPPARDRHHGQPQRRPVRPPAADGHERPARRRARARDPRRAGRRLPRDRQDHRDGAHAAVRHAPRRPPRPRRGDRRALPALRAAARGDGGRDGVVALLSVAPRAALVAGRAPADGRIEDKAGLTPPAPAGGRAGDARGVAPLPGHSRRTRHAPRDRRRWCPRWRRSGAAATPRRPPPRSAATAGRTAAPRAGASGPRVPTRARRAAASPPRGGRSRPGAGRRARAGRGRTGAARRAATPRQGWRSRASGRGRSRAARDRPPPAAAAASSPSTAPS